MNTENKSSTHKSEVIRIHLEPCPNADSLSIVKVFDSYQCVVRTADWQEGELAAFIVPDSMVDTTREEFAFLKRPNRDKERITVRRFRGNLSYGLLVKAPDGSQEEDDVSDYLGVTRYEPPLHVGNRYQVSFGQAFAASPPNLYCPVYGVESFHRYHQSLEEGEEIYVTEKIHGTSVIYVYHNNEFHVSSHRVWRKESESCLFWKTLHNYSQVKEWLKSHPDHLLYGEIYGVFQKFNYDTNDNIPKVRFFDVLYQMKFLDYHDPLIKSSVRAGIDNYLTDYNLLPWVPVLGRVGFNPYLFEYNKQAILDMSSGVSYLNFNHIREGIVIRPYKEKFVNPCGRVVLKCVSPEYLEIK